MTDGEVKEQLERAGKDLLRMPLPSTIHSLPHLVQGAVWYAVDAYGLKRLRWTGRRPSDDEIVDMLEILDWVTLLPPERFLLRQIVVRRLLVNPTNGCQYLFPFKRIAASVGAEVSQVCDWHQRGLSLIAAALSEIELGFPAALRTDDGAPRCQQVLSAVDAPFQCAMAAQPGLKYCARHGWRSGAEQW